MAQHPARLIARSRPHRHTASPAAGHKKDLGASSIDLGKEPFFARLEHAHSAHGPQHHALLHTALHLIRISLPSMSRRSAESGERRALRSAPSAEPRQPPAPVCDCLPCASPSNRPWTLTAHPHRAAVTTISTCWRGGATCAQGKQVVSGTSQPAHTRSQEPGLHSTAADTDHLVPLALPLRARVRGTWYSHHHHHHHQYH